ncbi:hypothetical protein [Schlesneria paludicola]|uniref:hypothetical protein n=1 Tax=Schlesneria paludicola TaxID=360056 RepID=UPI00029A2638|nr:hypothetical protein [Schlesneria paludicola]
MIAASPRHISATGENRELEFLLLGDLREILEQPVGPQTSCWLLAILDMLLVGRPHARQSVFLPVEHAHERYRATGLETGSLIDKLRRLRDRVAHRASHAGLANEIREELREVMMDRMSSAGCLYDA